jgi:hypothetical protein
LWFWRGRGALEASLTAPVGSSALWFWRGRGALEASLTAPVGCARVDGADGGSDEWVRSRVAGWEQFSAGAPELAARVQQLLAARPCYLATVDEVGAPRVHPVTPVVAADGIYVFMEPTSPKGKDLLGRPRYALHNGVPDNDGTGGEVSVRGTAMAVDDPARRVLAEAAASYPPAEHYVLFDLDVEQLVVTDYEAAGPARTRWSAP